MECHCKKYIFTKFDSRKQPLVLFVGNCGVFVEGNYTVFTQAGGSIEQNTNFIYTVSYNNVISSAADALTTLIRLLIRTSLKFNTATKKASNVKQNKPYLFA